MNRSKGKNKGVILIGQPMNLIPHDMNLIPLDRAKGASRSSDKSLGWRTRR
jgi:hypothetical protein